MIVEHSREEMNMTYNELINSLTEEQRDSLTKALTLFPLSTLKKELEKLKEFKTDEIMNTHKYLTSTYSGQELMKKHSLEEYGIWQIYGEDPNCDFGGSHYEPILDTIEGKLLDVVQIGVSLPRFYTWGGGGRFVKIEVKKI